MRKSNTARTQVNVLLPIHFMNQLKKFDKTHGLPYSLVAKAKEKARELQAGESRGGDRIEKLFGFKRRLVFSIKVNRRVRFIVTYSKRETRWTFCQTLIDHEYTQWRARGCPLSQFSHDEAVSVSDGANNAELESTQKNTLIEISSFKDQLLFLSGDQQKVRDALRSRLTLKDPNVNIVTGVAGTGKTLVAQEVIESIQSEYSGRDTDDEPSIYYVTSKQKLIKSVADDLSKKGHTVPCVTPTDFLEETCVAREGLKLGEFTKRLRHRLSYQSRAHQIRRSAKSVGKKADPIINPTEEILQESHVIAALIAAGATKREYIALPRECSCFALSLSQPDIASRREQYYDTVKDIIDGLKHDGICDPDFMSMVNRKRNEGQRAIVLIDEAQCTSAIKLLEILKLGFNIVMLGDPNQADISTNTLSLAYKLARICERSLFQADTELARTRYDRPEFIKKYSLEGTYRLPKQIAKVADNILKLKKKVSLIKGAFSIDTIPSCSDQEGLLTVATSKDVESIRKELSSPKMAFICPNGTGIDEKMKSLNWPIVISSDQAVGLEFEIIIISASEFVTPKIRSQLEALKVKSASRSHGALSQEVQNTLTTQLNRLYKAVTRAKQHLIISYDPKDSRILEFLKKHIAIQVPRTPHQPATVSQKTRHASHPKTRPADSFTSLLNEIRGWFYSERKLREQETCNLQADACLDKIKTLLEKLFSHDEYDNSTSDLQNFYADLPEHERLFFITLPDKKSIARFIHSPNLTGLTPLDQAIRDGHETLVHHLLQKGALITDGYASKNSAIRMYLDRQKKLNQSLYNATCDNNLQEVKQALSSFANTNQPNESGITPLLEASRKGSSEIVTALIEAGADLMCRNEAGECPLFIAAKSGHIKIVTQLIKHGADVSDVCMGKTAHDIAKNSAIKSLIAQAAQKKLKEMLKRGTQNSTRHKHNIKAGADGNAAGNDAATPPHLAGRYGCQKISHSLIGKANPNTADRDGTTPLHWAAKQGDKETADSLITAKADPNAADNKRKTPLYFAALNGHLETVKILIGKGADLTKIYDFDGIQGTLFNHVKNPKIKTTLRNSAQRKLISYVEEKNKKLENLNPIIRAGAQINQRISGGTTLLHTAVRNRDKEVVAALVQARASINEVDKDGNKPIFIATSHGYVDILLLLLEEGVDSNPLHWAVGNGFVDIATKLIEEHGTLDKTDGEGNTALHLAARKGTKRYVEIADKLIKGGANVDKADGEGNTSLHWAAKNGRITIADRLINGGADVNLLSHDGASPLHYASQEGYSKIVMLLINARADVNIANRYGTTPLGFARRYKHRKTAEILRLSGAFHSSTKTRQCSVLPFFLCLFILPLGIIFIAIQLIQFSANIIVFPKEIAKKIASLFVRPPADRPPLFNLNTTKKAIHNLIKYSQAQGILDKKSKSALLLLASTEGYNDIVKELISADTDPNGAIDQDGNTALNNAARNGHNKVVQQLLAKGANIEAADNEGKTALMWAAYSGHNKVMLALIKQKANIETTDNKHGFTALHMAAIVGKNSVIRQLLKHKANIEATAHTDDTACDLAIKSGHSETAQLLTF